MSRKCRGPSSASQPTVLQRSGSTECSTIVTRYFSKNGRISGGSARNRAVEDVLVRLEPPGLSRPRHDRDERREQNDRHGAHAAFSLAHRSAGRSARAVHQPAQRPEVAPVPRIGVAQAPALGRIELRRLEQHRQPCEARIVDQTPERFEPEAALADVLVPIDPAAARLLRIVQVKRREAIEANDAIEIRERVAIALFAAEVVAGRQQVAGIEADGDARRTRRGAR